MPKARLSIALVTLSLGSAAGCGAFALEGFTGGEDVGDAGTEGAGPIPSDARAEEEEDASSLPDGGGLDASDAADANPCVAPGMTTRICDAFERSQGVIVNTASPENWTNTSNALLVDDDAGTGKIASFSAGGDGGDTDSFLAFAAGDVRRVTVRGRVRVTSAAAPGRQIIVVKLIGNMKTAQVTLSVSDGNVLTLYEQIISGGGSSHAVTALGTGWHRVALDVDLVQNQIALTIDGVSALPPNDTFPTLPNFPTSGAMTISIGARFSGGTPITESQFDDVLLATATQ